MSLYYTLELVTEYTRFFFFFMVFIKIGTTYLKNIGGAMYANALNSNPLRPPSAGMYTVRLSD